jgi:membrane protein DedA with SNARE-associated domain/rhodanese-related sulfurtransferase
MTQLIELLQTHGYWFVLVAVLVEQIGVPVPAFPVLVIAGALVAEGTLSAPAVLAIAVVAALLGDLLWFQFGRHFGSRVLGWMCRLSLSPDRCVTDAERVFARFGLKALLVTRFFPGLAAIAPSLAGLSGYRRAPFIVFDALGGAIWSGAALAVGYVFHAEVERALAALQRLGLGAVMLILALLAMYVLWRVWRRRAMRLAMAVPRMTPEALVAALAGDAPPVVIDLRGPALRAAEPAPVPDARGVADPARERWSDWLPYDRDIVVVCACPDEASAAAVAARLRAQGWTRAHALRGGFAAWPRPEQTAIALEGIAP